MKTSRIAVLALALLGVVCTVGCPSSSSSGPSTSDPAIESAATLVDESPSASTLGEGEAEPATIPVEDVAGPEQGGPPTEPEVPSVIPTPDAVHRRVVEVESRLRSSEAGRLMMRSFERHGGLTAWFERGPLQFRFDYQPVRDGLRHDTRQVVDTWAVRVWHQLVADESAMFGWTGREVWASFDPEGASLSPRFWPLTPYSFVAMPFIAADPNVVLTLEGEGEVDGVPATLVRVGFEDAARGYPHDSVVVYLDQSTAQVLGLRHVMPHQGRFHQRGIPPEKFMRFDDVRRVDGILLPGSLPTFAWDLHAESRGELVTEITVSEVRFVADADPAIFVVPEGATYIERW